MEYYCAADEIMWMCGMRRGRLHRELVAAWFSAVQFLLIFAFPTVLRIIYLNNVEQLEKRNHGSVFRSGDSARLHVREVARVP